MRFTHSEGMNLDHMRLIGKKDGHSFASLPDDSDALPAAAAAAVLHESEREREKSGADDSRVPGSRESCS